MMRVFVYTIPQTCTHIKCINTILWHTSSLFWLSVCEHFTLLQSKRTPYHCTRHVDIKSKCDSINLIFASASLIIVSISLSHICTLTIAWKINCAATVTTGKCQLLPQLFLITAHFENRFSAVILQPN